MKQRKKIYIESNTIMEYNAFCRQCFWHPVGDALRLNLDGFGHLKLFLPAYQVDVIDKLNKNQMPGKHFIFLARYCKRPYYIGTNKIFFFDEEEAFIFKLCDGDIENVKEISSD